MLILIVKRIYLSKLTLNLKQREKLSNLFMDLAKANLLFSVGSNYLANLSFPVSLTLIIVHAIVAVMLTFISLSLLEKGGKV